MPWTDYGKKRTLEIVHKTASFSAPTTFYMALCTVETPPSAANTVDITDLVQVPQGNGYLTGGKAVTPGTVTVSGNNATLTFDNVVWTAVDGNLPDLVDARWAVLIDSFPTGGKVWYWWDLITGRQVSQFQSLTLVGAATRLLHEGDT